jgi:hypothetical protein
MNSITESGPMSKSPCEARKPAVKIRLSPGRKKPISSPDSAKTIRNRPT